MNWKKKLTNTFKLLHRNEQNTHKTSYLGVEEFHTPQALSLSIFIYGIILLQYLLSKFIVITNF
jgi:hypothetical protein